MGNIRCIELTKDNYKEYLEQVEALEEKVSEVMIQEGRIGQFFTTGKEGIEEYILSTNNSVMVALDDKNNVQSATYITQGQAPFTYNDITKYFKYGDEYKKYVKSLYKSDAQYKSDILKIYQIKLKAFEYAKDRVFKQCPKFSGNIMAYLENELQEKDNSFHEKSELREGLNKYMSEYIEGLANNEPEITDLYDKFYWFSAEDIASEFGKEYHLNSENMVEYESLLKSQKSQEYTQILQKGPLKILEEPKFDMKKYYNANTSNAVEIDTYITDPQARQSGVARIIVYEGLKKHIENHFKDENNEDIYLCSTLHRDNYSSKYVSEFFGLRDSMYVQRRSGRNREVHICKIARDDYKRYINDIEEKLIVLYGYNKDNKIVSDDRTLEILKEQLQYERNQVEHLKATSSGTYTGSFQGVQGKMKKIDDLKERAREVRGRIERQIKASQCGR